MIEAGQIYAWRGLPGQYDTNGSIVIDSLAASCVVNARVVNPAYDRSGELVPGEWDLGLISIGAADLIASIDAGWLILGADQELLRDRLSRAVEAAKAKIRTGR